MRSFSCARNPPLSCRWPGNLSAAKNGLLSAMRRRRQKLTRLPFKKSAPNAQDYRRCKSSAPHRGILCSGPEKFLPAKRITATMLAFPRGKRPAPRSLLTASPRFCTGLLSLLRIMSRPLRSRGHTPVLHALPFPRLRKKYIRQIFLMTLLTYFKLC